MKLRVISSLIFLGLSANTFAYDIKNGTVTETKWTTGKVLQSYVLENANSPKIANTLTVTAQALPAAGMHGQQTIVVGNHSVAINNTLGHDTQYIVFYSICADGNRCTYDKLDVSLKPGGTFQDTRGLRELVVFDYAATYQALATTTVQGDESAHTQGNNSIQIY